MSFSGDIEKFIKKTEAKTDVVFKKIVFDIYARVVRRSPVDTGRFKGNWLMTPNVPKAPGSVLISNNLPYAQRLEDGWSDQAPIGMVKVTVAEFQSIVKKALT